MMENFSSLIYGIVQGITEFLPVSSSAHLALLPHFLGIEDPGVVFDLSMHVGTALAVAVYFYRDLAILLHQFKSLVTGLLKNHSISKESAWAFNMIFATLISVVFILLLKPLAFKYGRNPLSMVMTLSSFGVFMLIADRFQPDRDELYMDQVQWKKSFMIGMFQAFAIFPGVSRSGATLTISRQLGLGREESTRFSFLLSLPIIFAGFFYKLPMIFKGDVNFEINSLVIGIIVSFFVGLLTIHYFLKFIKKIGLSFFAIYRILMAGIVYYYLA